MSNLRSTLVSSIAILLAVLVSWVHSEDTSNDDTSRYANPHLLLEPDTLTKSQIPDPFVVLDARPADDYATGHVPGAMHVDHDAWKAAFKEGQDRAGWTQRIRELGVTRETKIVVYDDKGMKDAARIWWILRFWGLKDVRLLNGGWKGWGLSKLPVTREVPRPATPSEFEAVPQSKFLATTDQLLKMVRDGKIQVVDARSNDEYCGIEMRDNKRGGAIPGARHLEWSDVIDQDTGRFKNAKQIKRLFDETGIDIEQPSASHCNGGGRAAVMAFTLELMGAEDVRNYYRGWGDWGNRDHTPVDVPKGNKTR